MNGEAASTVDPEEVEKFSRIAAEWWDPHGKFRPLHKFNPARLGYIRDAVTAHFQRDTRIPRPLDGLHVLDVGCGGGLVCEPMTRLGARVTGIDASARNIAVAAKHAAEHGLSIDYRATTVEALLAAGEAPFDVVLNLEVIEHVADPSLFLKASAALMKPEGLMVVATIARTVKAFALAKIGAEYVLGWLPRGSHDPKKFLRLDELTGLLRDAGLDVTGSAGVSYFPLLDQWKVTKDRDVNYMVTAAAAVLGQPAA